MGCNAVNNVYDINNETNLAALAATGKTDILIRNKVDGEVYRRYSFKVTKCPPETDPDCQ